jgi:GT2 family glycosyltransferase
MDLSVIILNWNTKSLLLECLESVIAATVRSPLQIQVLVVDNESDDGSVGAVRNAFPTIVVLENGRNLGFAAGNNRGLEIAKGRYCLLLNSDTIVPAGAFDGLVGAMDAHGQAAACSPLLLNSDGTPQVCWARFPGAKSELSGRLDRSQSPYPLPEFADAGRRSAMRPFPADWVGGACFLVRREAINAVGMLDEGFFMFSEETEWCHRFARHGWQTLVVPGVTVTHLGGQSAQAVPAETRRHLYRSILRLYRTLYGPRGAILPAAIATTRYYLSPLRCWQRRRGGAEPVQ